MLTAIIVAPDHETWRPSGVDPLDRILLAQAQLRGLSLLTCDRLIVEYAATEPGIPVCDARGRQP